jgi:hypothetical protein
MDTGICCVRLNGSMYFQITHNHFIATDYAPNDGRCFLMNRSVVATSTTTTTFDATTCTDAGGTPWGAAEASVTAGLVAMVNSGTSWYAPLQWARVVSIDPDTNILTVDGWKEFDGTSKLIREVTGRPVTLMRPPFGDFDARTNRWVRRNGMYPIMWNVDSADWRVEDPRQIAANILDAPGLGPGAIILLHDGGGDRSATVNALPMILDGLAKRGLRSVTLPELLRAGPPQGITPGSYAPSRYAEG